MPNNKLKLRTKNRERSDAMYNLEFAIRRKDSRIYVEDFVNGRPIWTDVREFARGYCYDVACKISKQIKKPQVEVVVLREKTS